MPKDQGTRLMIILVNKYVKVFCHIYLIFHDEN